MESLTANFIHFSSAIAKDYVRTQFRDFTKIFSFSKPFDNSWSNSYIQFVAIMI